MERDFLGLSDKQYLNNVKREVDDDRVGERGLSKKVAKQWGKAKLLPNSSFRPAAEDFQWCPVSAATTHRRSQFGGGAFQNANPLLLGGSVPLTNHPSLRPAFNSSTDPRVASSGSSPQLTIFYAGRPGTATVFNDISPDKARAIILCAGNGFKGEFGESSLRKPLRDTERVVYGKQIHKATAAASSSSATYADSFSRCKDKHVGATMSMIETFNACPSNMIPSVPQARKASLARFLEKRKERIMSAMPYKKMFLDLSTAESSTASHT